jgi:tetratricopeptide (TPR) repeat protein
VRGRAAALARGARAIWSRGALSAAHAAGPVHRGFDADGVLLGADGRALVVDLGPPLEPADADADQRAFCAALRCSLDGAAPPAGFELRRFEEAEGYYRRALRILDAGDGPDGSLVDTTLSNLADLLLEQGRLDEAQPLYARALALGEAADGPDHPDTAYKLFGLGVILHRRGQDAEARAPLARALAIREHAYGPDHPTVADCLAALAKVDRALGRGELARTEAARARRILAATSKP